MNILLDAVLILLAWWLILFCIYLAVSHKIRKQTGQKSVF